MSEDTKLIDDIENGKYKECIFFYCKNDNCRKINVVVIDHDYKSIIRCCENHRLECLKYYELIKNIRQYNNRTTDKYYKRFWNYMFLSLFFVNFIILCFAILKFKYG